MSVQGLILNSTAGGTIGANRIVKPGGTAGQHVVATAGTGVGVLTQPGGVVAGDRMDVQLSGLADIVAGGTIAAGAPFAADANGAAVAAAPATGVNILVLGFAWEAAVAGDIFRGLLAPHTMQGG